jgi:membrane-anchored protein YejM (alkaline phosphatase superfamily)
MIKNIISLALLIISVFLSLKHGWDSLHVKSNTESAKMMGELGIRSSYVPALGILMFGIGLLLLFPKTFFIGNLLNAMTILIIMALALHAGNYKMALMEIPFLMMPLILIWLKYPFKN